MKNMRLNYQVTVIGQVVSPFQYDHEMHHEKFYTLMLSVARASGQEDVLPVTISERLLDPTKDYQGSHMTIKGEFRSFDRPEELGWPKKKLFVFAQEVYEESIWHPFMNNEVILHGFICKEPQHRTTPNNREITDILMAVNRDYGKTDYIPCIAWGRTARWAGKLPVGTELKVFGRIQSRYYKKILEDGTAEIRTAYEVSISKIEEVRDGKSTTK